MDIEYWGQHPQGDKTLVAYDTFCPKMTKIFTKMFI
jgi:hypothetical protein